MLTSETMIHFLRTDRPPLGVDCDQCYSARASLLTAPYIRVRITATSLSKPFTEERFVLYAARFSGQHTQLDESPFGIFGPLRHYSVYFRCFRHTTDHFNILQHLRNHSASFRSFRHLSSSLGSFWQHSAFLGSIRYPSESLGSFQQHSAFLD